MVTMEQYASTEERQKSFNQNSKNVVLSFREFLLVFRQTRSDWSEEVERLS